MKEKTIYAVRIHHLKRVHPVKIVNKLIRFVLHLNINASRFTNRNASFVFISEVHPPKFILILPERNPIKVLPPIVINASQLFTGNHFSLLPSNACLLYSFIPPPKKSNIRKKNQLKLYPHQRSNCQSDSSQPLFGQLVRRRPACRKCAKTKSHLIKCILRLVWKPGASGGFRGHNIIRRGRALIVERLDGFSDNPPWSRGHVGSLGI